MINKNFWKNKKVFITGHTGFKGSWLCIYLNLLGAKITGYSLKPKSKPNLFDQANVKKIIKKSILADIRDYKKLYLEIKKSNPQIIFHLAAQSLVRNSYVNPRETFSTNIIGTLNILECIKNLQNIKSSIIVTTDKVYDSSKNKIFRESDSLMGLDPYSASKVCAENIFSSYTKSFFKNKKKQKLGTVRSGNVIGGGDYSEDRLIPDIYRFAKKKKKILLRYPNAIRPWQHVLDPLSGYLILAEKLYHNQLDKHESNWNFAPNLNSCKSVKYISTKFAKDLKLKINVAKSKKEHIKPETNFLRLSNFKAKKFLKWRPKWNLNISIKKILEWHKMLNFKNARVVCEDQIKEFLRV